MRHANNLETLDDVVAPPSGSPAGCGCACLMLVLIFGVGVGVTLFALGKIFG